MVANIFLLQSSFLINALVLKKSKLVCVCKRSRAVSPCRRDRVAACALVCHIWSIISWSHSDFVRQFSFFQTSNATQYAFFELFIFLLLFPSILNGVQRFSTGISNVIIRLFLAEGLQVTSWTLDSVQLHLEWPRESTDLQWPFYRGDALRIIVGFEECRSPQTQCKTQC